MALAALSRPRLLAAAARAGAAQYRRERDLPGLLASGASGRGLLSALAAAEADCDADRRVNAPGYSVARHVKLLAALIAETRATLAAAERKAPAAPQANEPVFERKSAFAYRAAA
jgi:hypothetical protein